MNGESGGNGESVEGAGSLLTRRELLGASAALGTAAIASGSGAVGSAEAQTSEEPRIQLGEDYAIDDNPDGEGDLVLEHLASGSQFRYDSSEDTWSVGSFSTAEALINNNQLYIQSSEPTSPEEGDVWIDNSLDIGPWSDVKAVTGSSSNIDYATTDEWASPGLESSEYDSNDDWDPSTQEFTAPTDGMYVAIGHATFVNPSDQDRVGKRLDVNGLPEYITWEGFSGTFDQGVELKTRLELSEGDTLEFKVRNYTSDTNISYQSSRTKLLIWREK